MATPFGDRQRRRNREMALSELPAWGLEIMMGLYGPDTVGRLCADEKADGVSAKVIDDSPGQLQPERPWQERLGSYDWGGEPSAGGGTGTSTRPDSAPPRHVEPMTPVTMQIEAVNQLVHYLERKFKRH
ncbi:hypothetical protein AAFP30_01605 [Gordonia sp. CPCC 205515]|uniref:hypothetical protein n=1 Tax=Gordonia sp. CPCC 205515 TaxID=3140791 RepID=UPI003AF3B2A7